ncbi:MAG: DNA mismatch repair protein MutL, partial [Bacillota bacterium]|nr:DNA mismatch repair protein MutL [Bacillota bacterium]
LITSSIKAAFKTKELIPSGYSAVKRELPASEQTALSLDEFAVSGKNYTTIKETGASSPESMWVEPGQNYDSIFSKIHRASESPSSVDEVENDISIDEDQQNELKTGVEGTKKYGQASDVMDLSNEDAQREHTTLPDRVPPLYPIGQMHGTYIFAQNEKGLYIIDQHAAQERIKYEYYREKVGNVENELQELLVPLTFDYSVDEYMKIEENKNELEKVGVFLEEFGMNSYIVRAHPQWFPNGQEKEIIEELIEQVLSMKKADVKKLREEAAIMMSCKASIKANRHLRNDEIMALLEELRKASDPFTCPHGRPIIIQYSIYDMEKMFKRVM